MDGHESVNNLATTLMGISLDDWNSVSIDDLTVELVIDILSRLPVKTVLITACVCKRLYSIIKTPVFVSAYHSSSISNPSNKYILLAPNSSLPDGPDDHSFYVYSTDKLPTLHAKIKIPFETVSNFMQLVGSCNGLVCISIINSSTGCHSGDIYLINPFVQNYKKLNAEDSCYPDLVTGRYFIAIGFGYSDVENDYKVVRCISDFCVNSYPFKTWSKAEVYSLRSGKWKEVIHDSAYGLLSNICSLVVDGCLYWLSFNYDTRYYLQCFDLNDEVFLKIELPAKLIELCSDHVPDTFQLNGSLALYTLGDRLCIFMMEKGRDNSGQVNWKEMYLELINEEVSVSYYRLRLYCSGRLESEDLDCSHEMEDESDVEDGRIFKLFAPNLDNLNAPEARILDFEKKIYYQYQFHWKPCSFFRGMIDSFASIGGHGM